MDDPTTARERMRSRPPAVDDPAERPGVPMNAAPRWDPASTGAPARQPNGEEHLVRAGLAQTTPVFGTAQPPRGLSGVIRRQAYTIPEHYGRHWMLLMAADRVDVAEHRLGDALAAPLEQAGFERGAHIARSYPLGVAGGAVLGAWIVKRMIR